MTPTTTIQPIACSVSDCAQALGVSSDFVRSLLKKGQIRGSKVGQRVLIPVSELSSLLDRNRL